MNNPSSTVDSRTALRRLSAPHALAFGSRLLDRQGPHLKNPGPITFREFLRVARELVTHKPEQSAIYLAALVALDMTSEDCILADPFGDPSNN
ncbi:MAG: hypothetical protein NXI31_16335 [bacterium]|nr:hypothetical protein [bacterium]